MYSRKTDAPVGWFRFNDPAGSPAGTAEKLFERRRDAARAARSNAPEIQCEWIGRRLLGREQDQGVYAIDLSNVKRSDSGQQKLALLIALVRKAIARVVAGIEELPAAVAIDVEHIDPARIGDAVDRGQCQLEFIALMGELVFAQRG